MDLEVAKQADAIEAQYAILPCAMRTASALKALADDSRAMQLLIRYQSRLIRQREAALESLRALQKERKEREAEEMGEMEEIKVAERTQDSAGVPPSEKGTESKNEGSTRVKVGGKVGSVRLRYADGRVTSEVRKPEPEGSVGHLN